MPFTPPNPRPAADRRDPLVYVALATAAAGLAAALIRAALAG